MSRPVILKKKESFQEVPENKEVKEELKKEIKKEVEKETKKRHDIMLVDIKGFTLIKK